jgi:YfiH family protein
LVEVNNNENVYGIWKMIIEPAIFRRCPDLKTGMSTRQGGVSEMPYGMNCSYRVGDEEKNVGKNREIFFAGIGIPSGRIAAPQQEHTDIVNIAETPGEYPHCDALITPLPDIYLSVMVADCVPILLYDPRQKIAAAVHAGWRGVDSRIVQKTLQIMNKEWHSMPSDILAFVGPSAGECCYEIGAETAVHFKENVLRERNRRLYLNIKEGVRFQMLDEGVRSVNMEMRPECTICDARFHSYRRDGKKSGRMMAVIGRKD